MRKTDQKLIDSRISDILTAALNCFVRSGFNGTSMRDIASETGVSLGLLYRYFQDKAAIVAAAITADSGAFDQRLAALGAEGITNESLLNFLKQEVMLRSDSAVFALTAEILAEAARNPIIAEGVRQNLLSAEINLAQVMLDHNNPTPEAQNVTLRHASRLLGLVDILAFRIFLKLETNLDRELRATLAQH